MVCSFQMMRVYNPSHRFRQNTFSLPVIISNRQLLYQSVYARITSSSQFPPSRDYEELRDEVQGVVSAKAIM